MIRGNMTVQAISPKDLLIYLCLRRYRNSDTGESSVPISKIAELTGASPVTILSSLDRLKAARHIEYNKRGRQNFYMFISDIDAKSYDFLDKEMSHSDKINEALKTAYVPNEDNDPNQGDSRLYGYIASLEDTINLLRKQVQTLTAELNKTNKYVSVITGKPYVPVDIV